MNYKILRETFYNTYKSYMEFLRLTNQGKEMFYILILRKPLDNDLTNVDIVINGINSRIEGHSYRFKNNVILNNIEAKNLIDEIRNDFKMYHTISYCTVNEAESIQRMQNTNYSLNINLISEEELDEALKFNYEINTNKERKKALIKE